MAKKSTAARNSGVARRPQPTAKNPVRQVTLVRTPEMVAAGRPGAAGAASATPTAGNVTPSGSASATTGARAAAKPATGSAASVARVATSGEGRDSSAQARCATDRDRTAPAPRGAQASRAARAQAVQRARTVHLISAENYSYVINDLKLTGILAAAMFFVILVLHFIIG